jgi:hypothetical protein
MAVTGICRAEERYQGIVGGTCINATVAKRHSLATVKVDGFPGEGGEVELSERLGRVASFDPKQGVRLVSCKNKPLVGAQDLDGNRLETSNDP